jgi:hypothetical protein
MPVADRLRKEPRNERETFQGLPIIIEYRKGDEKPNNEDADYGYPLYADYGYLEDTTSPEEGEELDVYLGPNPDSENAFLVSMNCKGDPDQDEGAGQFDEFKVLLGFDDYDAAEDFINNQYGSSQVGVIMETSVKDLKEEIALGKLKNQKEKLVIDAEDEPIDTSMAGPVTGDYGQKGDSVPQIVVPI